MSTELGRQAEATASRFLRRHKHTILAQNWRTRWCEIDIVSRRRNIIYFIEVKYRAATGHGAGLEYITPRKLQQMHFAAAFWIAQQAQEATEYELGAIEVAGPQFAITEWIEGIEP